MTYFHGFTSFQCFGIPVPRGRPFRLRHTPLSCRLRAGVGFLGYPVPPPPFVGLTTFIPRSRGGYGFPGSVSKIPIDAVGATLRPGTSTSVCHPEGVPVMARFRCRFGSSVVSPWFHLLRMTIFFGDSAFSSPWRRLPGGWSRSGFYSSPRCPAGFTQPRYQDRMPRQVHLKRIRWRIDPKSPIQPLVAPPLSTRGAHTVVWVTSS